MWLGLLRLSCPGFTEPALLVMRLQSDSEERVDKPHNQIMDSEEGIQRKKLKVYIPGLER
jgi:hypothetical protein